MNIDQNWVTDNIDLIMKYFSEVHPEYKKKDDNVTMASRSRERKKMLEDMDTMKYRPIYYIVKNFPDREKALRLKVKDMLQLKNEYKKSNEVLISREDSYEMEIKKLKEKNRIQAIEISYLKPEGNLR